MHSPCGLPSSAGNSPNTARLLDWFLAQNQKTIRGYRPVIYSGVTTNYLAELVASIHPGASWIEWALIRCSSEPISKYDLLCLLREVYRLDSESNLTIWRCPTEA